MLEGPCLKELVPVRQGKKGEKVGTEWRGRATGTEAQDMIAKERGGREGRH